MKKVKWSLVYCTCLGIGYFPRFPGTMGSIFAFLIYLILPESIFSQSYSNAVFTGIVILLSLISIPVISRAERYLGHDSGKIVIDEFFGFMIAVAFLPKGLVTGIIAFVLFRIFDISKLEPVNQLQKLPGGCGVMADDVMAGIYANIFARIIMKIIL